MGVFVQTYYIMLPGPGPGSVLCVIRERHVVLKAVLYSRLAV